MSSIFDNLFNKEKNNSSDGEIEYIGEKPESTDDIKVTVRIFGQVQGVGFRYSTKEAADRHNIRGIVRNEADGSVYVEGAGTDDNMKQFIEILRNGPAPASNVDRVVVEYDESIKERDNFSVSN